MKYMLLIHQGSTPLPGSPEWDALPEDEQGAVYAAYKALNETAGRTRNAIIDFAPEAQKSKLSLWPRPGPDFELMKRIKQMFDPEHLLNRGRLYNQL